MQKPLISLGLLIVLIGLAWPLITKLGLGQLLDALIIRKANFTFYLPIVTCIVISLIISLVLWFINK